jgi:anaphase-promoting complex subunit 4
MALDLGSFSPLGTFSVPPKTRLVQGACNPEKDLVLLIHRGEPRDTISLWKLQGAKRWEIDTIANYETTGLLRDVSWSPDGKLSMQWSPPYRC